jgi:hypothetical protein
MRIQRPKGRTERWWLEVFPMDPRDTDVVRAKAIDRGWGDYRRIGSGPVDDEGDLAMRRRGRSAPGRDATEWLARTLLDQGMPPSEVRGVLEADDYLKVRRHIELHRERLTERLADQVRELEVLERMLVGRTTSTGRARMRTPVASEPGRVAPIAPLRGAARGFSPGRHGGAA